MEQDGKLLHHRCGYPLWSVVHERFNGVMLVNYRDQSPRGLLIFICPGCGKSLQLWWQVPGQVVETDPSSFIL